MDDESQDELVTVFIAGNAIDVAQAESILNSAHILYYAKGESLQNIVGYGIIGLGYNPVVGPVEIQVVGTDAKQSRELLAELDGVTEEPKEMNEEEIAIEEAGYERLQNFERRIGMGTFLGGMLIVSLLMIYWLIRHL